MINPSQKHCADWSFFLSLRIPVLLRLVVRVVWGTGLVGRVIVLGRRWRQGVLLRLLLRRRRRIILLLPPLEWTVLLWRLLRSLILLLPSLVVVAGDLVGDSANDELLYQTHAAVFMKM